MTQFIMSVGLPASGKTYYAHRLENFQIFSSDEIRNELFPGGDGYTKENQAVVFRTLGNRVRASLLAGENTFYDATNMDRKLRMNFLTTLKDFDNVGKSCYLFATPIEVCKIRNKFREEQVPDSVYDRMTRRFCVPIMNEGWDEIRIINDGSYNVMDLRKLYDLSFSLDQHNEHHSLTIGEHAEKTVNNLRKDVRFKAMEPDEKVLLAHAAKYHDIGKIFALSKVNSKGEEDGNWHYYGHEHIGSYLVASTFQTLGSLDCALLIELHMRPFDYEKSVKAEERDRALFGDCMIDLIKMIHDADVAAH